MLSPNRRADDDHAIEKAALILALVVWAVALIFVRTTRCATLAAVPGPPVTQPEHKTEIGLVRAGRGFD